MYQKPPTDEELQAVGLSRDDFDDDEVEEIFVTQDMLDSWNIFMAMQTQWRSAGSGAYGLDYNVLPMMFDIYKIENRELALDDLRLLEAKALEIMHLAKK